VYWSSFAGQKTIVVLGKEVEGQSELTQVPGTSHLLSNLLGLKYCGDQDSHEQGNYSHDYEQFNQGKSPLGPT